MLQVLKDRERLVKRTQLKRSVYRVLGTCEAAPGNGTSGTSRTAEEGTTEEDKSGQDSHLCDYDPEIFDDDDFYHQVHACRYISVFTLDIQ